MKKTVTINISGIAFTIDEDAFDKLSTYLETIKSYFKASEGCEEIMADIEARIAEMFQQKVTGHKQVINMEDVEEVISIMGQPEDYVDEETKEEQQTSANDTTSSGYTRANKRLFRDRENAVLGGVCSGIGWYFGVDPLWFRLAFAVSFFVFGTGFLFYLLLWIIVPEATTTAEKLEMKGERVNINNISKTIEEEMEDLKKRFREFKKKANTPENKKQARDIGGRIESVIHNLFEFVFQLVTLILKAAGKIIGVAFIISGVVLLVMLLATLLKTDPSVISIASDGIYSISFPQVLHTIFDSEEQLLMTTIGLLLLVGIPLIAIVYGGIRLLFGIRHELKGLGLIFTSIWLAGLALTLLAGFQVSNNFRVDTTIEKNIPVEQPASDTLYIESGHDIFNREDRWDNDIAIHYEKGQLFFGNVKLDVVRSDHDSIEIVLHNSSYGTNLKKAQNNARNLQYEVTQSDSLFSFAPYYSIEKGTKWRHQELEVIVKIPEGKAVYFKNNADLIIYDIENVTNTWDGDMVGKTWTMLEDGLTCVGCDEDEL